MPTAHVPVGVEVESRPAATRWLDRVVRITGIRPGARHIPDWSVLAEEGGITRYYAGTARMTIHAADAAVYKDNVESPEPAVYVVLRRGGGPLGWSLLLATVDPSEAHAHVDVGDDLVEALPMPPDLHAWLAAFVARHYVERPKWKRQRDAAPADPGRRPPAPAGDEGFLGRWSRRKQEASPRPGDPATPTPAPPVPETPAPPDAANPLPPLESLRSRGDYAAYLRDGVPKALRHAALRQAWASDPAITGHKPLVDYAWDFNAPGYGALKPTDDATKLTDALFRHLREPAAEADAPETVKEAEAEAETGAETRAEDQAAPAEPAPHRPADPLRGDPAAEPVLSEAPRAAPPADDAPAPTDPEPPAPRPPRRHGGAVPT